MGPTAIVGIAALLTGPIILAWAELQSGVFSDHGPFHDSLAALSHQYQRNGELLIHYKGLTIEKMDFEACMSLLNEEAAEVEY